MTERTGRGLGTRTRRARAPATLRLRACLLCLGALLFLGAFPSRASATSDRDGDDAGADAPSARSAAAAPRSDRPTRPSWLDADPASPASCAADAKSPAWRSNDATTRFHADDDDPADECAPFYRRYDRAVAADRVLIVRDGYPGLGLGEWLTARARFVVTAALADRRVLFESCEEEAAPSEDDRTASDGAASSARWAPPGAPRCDERALPVTFEALPTGSVPLDFAAYFRPRGDRCEDDERLFRDPETRAHPRIPADAARVARTKEERSVLSGRAEGEDASEANRRRVEEALRRRVLDALLGDARVVVFEEVFADLVLERWAEEEWARRSEDDETRGEDKTKKTKKKSEGGALACCAMRALTWRPARPLLALLREFERDATRAGDPPPPYRVAFHLRTYDLDDEECRYPYVPPPGDESESDAESDESESVIRLERADAAAGGAAGSREEAFFPDWAALDASVARCAASYGRAESLRNAPKMSALLEAAAGEIGGGAGEGTMYVFTDSRAAQGFLETRRFLGDAGEEDAGAGSGSGSGSGGASRVVVSRRPFEYPTKHYYYTASDVLDLWLAAQAEVIARPTPSSYTRAAACLARGAEVLDLDALERLARARG